MKRFLLLLISAFLCSQLFSQPCEGIPLLKESFDSGIPGNWTILNLDTHTVYWPLAGRGYTGMFQSFTHLGRKCVANVAYFSATSLSADDWLITPAVTLGASPVCLSWQASTMYAWAQTYEIRISTTTPTVSAFMLNPALFTQAGEQQGWNQYSVDLSAYAGQTVYIGIFYNATDQYPVYFDDIRITNPVTRDASVKSLDMNEVVPVGSYPIKGQLLNGGISAISFMNINWNVNNGPVNTVSLSSLNILPSVYSNYTHSINWNPSVNGTYILKVWASNINGLPDMYTSNDTLRQIAFVHNHLRKALIEEFTNTDCSPCGQQNPAFDALLAPNQATGKLSMIKYHPMWPGNKDPMYLYDTLDIPDRLYYYGTAQLPNASLNGFVIPGNNCSYYSGAPACLTQTKIDSMYAVPSIFDMQLSNSISGSTMNIHVGVTALTNIPFSSFTLRCAAVEDSIIYSTPPGSNGETKFYQTMRKMFPNSNGVSLGTMTANQTLTYNFSWVVDTPANHSLLRTVAFIQDDSTLKVYQSEMTNSIAMGINELSANNMLTISPNPTNGVFQIQANSHPLITNNQIKIYNVLWEEVFSTTMNNERLTINLSEANSGVYFLQVKTNEGTAVKKIVISH